MAKKKTNCVALSLNEFTFELVQFKGTGAQARVHNIVSKEIAGLSGNDLTKLIQTTISDLKLKKSYFVSVVPSGIITTKNIEVPSVKEEEIESIVNLQASRHTPFSREEIEIGYINLGVHKANYSKVLLVIANKLILQEQIDVFEKAGVEIQEVVFAPESIAKYYSSALKIKESETPTALIDVGDYSTDFLILFKNNLISSRNIPTGKVQLKESADLYNVLVDEISKTLESYQNEDIEQAPGSFVLTTEDDVTRKLESVLKNKFSSEIKFSPYFDHAKIKSGVLKKLATDFENVSFLDLIVPILEQKNSKINLLPEDVVIQRSIATQGKEIYKCAILGFIVLLLVACSIGIKIYFKSNYLEKLKVKFKDNRETVEFLERKSLETRGIQEFFKYRMISLDTINELYRNIPPEIYLTSIYMDEEGNVSIQGISDIASLVFNLGSSLKESELFKSVEIKSTTAKKDRGKDVSAFEISLKLITAKEEAEKTTVEE